MGSIIAFFAGGPARIQALLIGAAAVALACLSLLVWGLYWRGEYRDCKTQNVVLVDQVQVLSDKLETQSAAIVANAEAGREAVAIGRQLLGEARKKGAPAARAAEPSAAIAGGPARAGKTCADAWREIERQQQIRVAP